jgi:hypothetical protein
MAASLAIAGLAVSAIGAGTSLYMSNEANNDTQDRLTSQQESANRIAAAEGENASYATELQDRREEIADQYLPAYAALSSEVQKETNYQQDAQPVLSAVVAGGSSLMNATPTDATATGTAIGTARQQAVDLGVQSETAVNLGAVNPSLSTAIDLEDYSQRKQAVDLGKDYMGGI